MERTEFQTCKESVKSILAQQGVRLGDDKTLDSILEASAQLVGELVKQQNFFSENPNPTTEKICLLNISLSEIDGTLRQPIIQIAGEDVLEKENEATIKNFVFDLYNVAHKHFAHLCPKM